jgi:hypothetical protein
MAVAPMMSRLHGTNNLIKSKNDFFCHKGTSI